MYKVSVIIPTYNSERYIERTFNSLMNQSIGFENIEVIVVDDNSSDNTKTILKNLELKYDNIKCFYYEDNSGSPSRGRNTGIDLASSNYLMFLDHDDVYDKFYCEKMVSTIEKFNVDIVLSTNSSINVNDLFELNSLNDDSFILVNPKENKSIFLEIFMWSKIFKTSFIRDYNIYCPITLHEDVVFCFKAYMNCDKLVYIKDYKGYDHVKRGANEDYSTGAFMSYNSLIKLIAGFREVFEYGQNHKKHLDWLMEEHMIHLCYYFAKANLTHDEKIKILEEIYDMQEEFGWYSLSEFFARIINDNIRKKNFKRTIFIGKVIKFLKSSDFLTKIYYILYGRPQ